MIVRRGIRVIPYCLYEPMIRRKALKYKQEEHETISLQALFICLCVCVYACAISSLVLLTSNNSLVQQVRYFCVQNHFSHHTFQMLKALLYMYVGSHLGIVVLVGGEGHSSRR